MSKEIFFNWCIEKHGETNQLYAGYLPYRFHLEMTHHFALKFKAIWEHINKKYYDSKIDFEIIECCCYSHDLIEDACCTYGDIVKQIKYIYSLPAAILQRAYAEHIPEITRAVCCDVRGRNRIERMPDSIYEEIKNTPGATFVKLCDRLANVHYGGFHKTKMLETYKEENIHFKNMLYQEDYKEMWNHLEYLFLETTEFYYPENV